jgi:hypothetical protein
MAVKKIPDWERLERWYKKWTTEYISGTSGCLPILRMLAKTCDTVVEFGVKKGVSSVALILGARRQVISYDIATNSSIEFLQEFAGPRWKFIQADTRKVDIPKCDMIFFDSLHTYEQLSCEIRRHARMAKKLLVFHDTITFGVRGANGETGEYIPGWKAGKWDPKTAGIRMAIDEFMIKNRHWRMKQHYRDSNGLLILERC